MHIQSSSIPPFDWHGLAIQDLSAGLQTRTSIAHISVPPGASHPTAWSRRAEKYYILLAGQLHFYCEGSVYLLEEGDLFQVLQGQRFAYANRTNRPVELLLAHTPRFDPQDDVLEGPFFAPPRIYHVARRVEWQAAAGSAVYAPAAFASDGFIHLCEAGSIEGVGSRYFRGQEGLVLLQVDPLRVQAPIRYEDLLGGGLAYPHIYGPLNVDAVDAVIPFPPNPDGTFSVPPQVG